MVDFKDIEGPGQKFKISFISSFQDRVILYSINVTFDFMTIYMKLKTKF